MLRRPCQHRQRLATLGKAAQAYAMPPSPRCLAALVSTGNDWQHWAERTGHSSRCPSPREDQQRLQHVQVSLSAASPLFRKAQPPLSAWATTGNTGQSDQGKRQVLPIPRCSAALVSTGNDWQHWAEWTKHSSRCPFPREDQLCLQSPHTSRCPSPR